MDKADMHNFRAFFSKPLILNLRVFSTQFNNAKPELADEVLYGISPFGLLLFNLLLHIDPLSYTLSSIFFTSQAFMFVTIFLFF